MAIEETIENKAQEVAFAGGRVALRTTWKIARFLLACGWTITKGGVKLTADQIEHHLNSGLMSEKRLQRQGEDIHTTTIPAEALKNLAPSMKRAGLDYSIDINDDDTVTLYFKSKDADHITHAVERALKNAGLEASQLKDGEPDKPVPTHDAPDAQTPGQQPAGADAPDRQAAAGDHTEHTMDNTPRTSTTEDPTDTHAPTDAARQPSATKGEPTQPRTRKDLIAAFKQEAARRIDAKHQQQQAPKRTVKQTRTTTNRSGR